MNKHQKRKIIKCCVPFCKSKRMEKRSSEDEVYGMTFHTFPVDFLKRDKWIQAIRAVDPGRYRSWYSFNHSFVCSLHFKPEQYRTCKFEKRLLSGSVPSIFPKLPQSIAQNAVGLKKIAPRKNTANILLNDVISDTSKQNTVINTTFAINEFLVEKSKGDKVQKSEVLKCTINPPKTNNIKNVDNQTKKCINVSNPCAKTNLITASELAPSVKNTNNRSSDGIDNNEDANILFNNITNADKNTKHLTMSHPCDKTSSINAPELASSVQNADKRSADEISEQNSVMNTSCSIVDEFLVVKSKGDKVQKFKVLKCAINPPKTNIKIVDQHTKKCVNVSHPYAKTNSTTAPELVPCIKNTDNRSSDVIANNVDANILLDNITIKNTDKRSSEDISEQKSVLNTSCSIVDEFLVVKSKGDKVQKFKVLKCAINPPKTNNIKNVNQHTKKGVNVSHPYVKTSSINAPELASSTKNTNKRSSDEISEQNSVMNTSCSIVDAFVVKSKGDEVQKFKVLKCAMNPPETNNIQNVLVSSLKDIDNRSSEDMENSVTDVIPNVSSTENCNVVQQCHSKSTCPDSNKNLLIGNCALHSLVKERNKGTEHWLATLRSRIEDVQVSKRGYDEEIKRLKKIIQRNQSRNEKKMEMLKQFNIETLRKGIEKKDAKSLFLYDQLHSLTKEKNLWRMLWSESTMEFTEELVEKFPAAYDLLRQENIVNLPSLKLLG